MIPAYPDPQNFLQSLFALIGDFPDRRSIYPW